MPTKPLISHGFTPVPLEHAGRWIAWSSDHSQIVASSDSMEELWKMVHERRISDPIFEKAPRSDVRFVGIR